MKRHFRSLSSGFKSSPFRSIGLITILSLFTSQDCNCSSSKIFRFVTASVLVRGRNSGADRGRPTRPESIVLSEGNDDGAIFGVEEGARRLINLVAIVVQR